MSLNFILLLLCFDMAAKRFVAPQKGSSLYDMIFFPSFVKLSWINTNFKTFSGASWYNKLFRKVIVPTRVPLNAFSRSLVTRISDTH